MSTHTPGPWQLSPGANDAGLIVAGKSLSDRGSVASVHWRESQEEFSANAHLIAAAPALLEALEACIASGGLERSGNDANAQNAADKARAAIAQAKGE